MLLDVAKKAIVPVSIRQDYPVSCDRVRECLRSIVGEGLLRQFAANGDEITGSIDKDKIQLLISPQYLGPIYDGRIMPLNAHGCFIEGRVRGNIVGVALVFVIVVLAAGFAASLLHLFFIVSATFLVFGYAFYKRVVWIEMLEEALEALVTADGSEDGSGVG